MYIFYQHHYHFIMFVALSLLFSRLLLFLPFPTSFFYLFKKNDFDVRLPGHANCRRWSFVQFRQKKCVLFGETWKQMLVVEFHFNFHCGWWAMSFLYWNSLIYLNRNLLFWGGVLIIIFLFCFHVEFKFLKKLWGCGGEFTFFYFIFFSDGWMCVCV